MISLDSERSAQDLIHLANEQEAQIESLRAERDALAANTRILEWVLANQPVFCYSGNQHECVWFEGDGVTEHTARGATPREALEKAACEITPAELHANTQGLEDAAQIQ